MKCDNMDEIPSFAHTLLVAPGLHADKKYKDLMTVLRQETCEAETVKQFVSLVTPPYRAGVLTGVPTKEIKWRTKI